MSGFPEFSFSSAPAGDADKIAIDALATIVCGELVAQEIELDNLGDGESVLLVGNAPAINLALLAERILALVPIGANTRAMLIEAAEAAVDRMAKAPAT